MSNLNNIHTDTNIYPPHTLSTNNLLTITQWDSNGCARHTIEAVTNSILSTHLLFLTETWLLSPLRFLTNWRQFHTYAVPVDNTYRGEMGISLLVHPDCPHPVTHFPSTSPYVLSCQVSNLLIHCVYLPPALPDAVLQQLPTQTHPSQANTIICGDFNARYSALLGDSRTTQRGTAFYNWMVENGLHCWNSELTFGIPTYNSHSKINQRTGIHF
ncbi:hypothetical protein BCV72DRAFT_212417 [Rhizopus microsporus var. microsporus]|uniref:Endonuclease/exonuclease/phosphatase domain-containing protein n=1 Tax=Rhizopus microsporus var. microsporus TaxID=86635 RepID=A0A1X0QVW4_RHIZD|nr:hypothetical protein BCV72DRAFT_212417 [Rhizopus microsporus var. microsporus]